MAYTTIDKPTDYFNTKLYTGNGTTDHAITGVGFRPDFFWGKKRSASGSHFLVNSISGIGKHLHSDASLAETTFAEGVKSFDSDGVTIGTAGDINDNSQTFVAWNWLASNTTASNTDGSITSTVSANTTSGFSIVSYTGTGANATVGHGLGVAPKVVIIKDRDNSTSWVVGGDAIGTTDNNYLLLNETNALDSASTGFQSFSTTTVGLGSDTWFNGSSRNYIAYCFAEKKGFSKFGSYTGNGNADGTFVYTGFKPAFVIIKRTDTTNNWGLFDNKRNSSNPVNKLILPNSSNAEDGNNTRIDMYSNGFKPRVNDPLENASGGNYIYMAFAEEPLVGDNPATAR